MKPNECRANDDAGRFRTTHWSVVLLSAQSQVPGSRTALADLCRLYWYPLYAEKLQVSLGGVKTLIHRLRKRYSELVREEVARTVTNPEAVDEEIQAICEALIAVEGQLGP